MPIIKKPDHLIISDTKFITMTAFRDGPVFDPWCCDLCPPHEHQGEDCDLCKPHDHEPPTREWYLTVNMSGACIEFLAAEGMEGYMVTYDQALSRITEFEANMRAENQNYVQSLVKTLMNKIEANDENK